ncbi:unnamed protein product [Lathyrus sativus]|nr:unnamed protein product [Lathyrus sativus]
MKISYTSNRFLLFIIFTACLCIYFAIQMKKTNETKGIPISVYSSILGPKLDKLPNQDDVKKLFQLWKKEQGRVYRDQKEMEKKFDTFVSNVKYIVETNAKRHSPNSAFLGLTKFTDMSNKEYKKRYMTLKTYATDIWNDDDVQDVTCSDPPATLDWRLNGAVTSVKDQGGCGACWAFSTVAAIEGIVAINTGTLISLSEQEVLDCVLDGDCDEGGFVPEGFKWVVGNLGVASRADYPYTASKGVCKSAQFQNSANSRIDSHQAVPRSDRALLCAVAKQPISIGVYADSPTFKEYKGGIFRGEDCPADPKNVTHAMVIVGYNSLRVCLVRGRWRGGEGRGGKIFN